MNSSDLSSPTIYYSIDKINEHFKSNSFNGINLLHLSISSLPYNYEQLNTLLADIDRIDIIETRLKTGQKALNDINIENYVMEHTTTDATIIFIIF